MVGTKVSKELIEKVYEAAEIAKATGKVKKGTNEVTKAVEKGNAKLVAIASDISPAEIVMHIPAISIEKGNPCIEVGSKEELGAAAGLDVPTSAVAIVAEGDSAPIIKEIKRELAKAGEAQAEIKSKEAPKEESKPEKNDADAEKADEKPEDKDSKADASAEAPKESAKEKEDKKE